MKIVIDWDNTILETSTSVIQLWEYLHPLRKINKVSINDVEWDFSNVLKDSGVTLKELLSILDYKYFYNHAILIDGALETIKELAKDNEIIICSKHMNSRKEITKKFIEEIFPNVKLMFAESFDKSFVGECDLFIDDRIDALQSMRGQAKELIICYGDYKWNKDWTDKRATNWLEIEKIINGREI